MAGPNDVVAARKSLIKFSIEGVFDPQTLNRIQRPHDSPAMSRQKPKNLKPMDSQMATARMPAADSGAAPAAVHPTMSKGLDDLAKMLAKAERCCGITWTGGGLKGCPKCKKAFGSE